MLAASASLSCPLAANLDAASLALFFDRFRRGQSGVKNVPIVAEHTMKTILRMCAGYHNKQCVTISADVDSGYLEGGHTNQNIIDEKTYLEQQR